MTTARASLGSIGRVHQHDLSSSVCSFGDKSVVKVALSLIQDAFAKVTVPYHVDDLQIFKRDQIIGLRVGIRDLIEYVLTLVLDMFVQALDAQDCLASILAALLFALYTPLRNRQGALYRPIVFGRFDTFASAVSEQIFDIQIDPDLLPSGFKLDWIRHFTAKANVPLACCTANTRGLDFALNGTMPKDRHPTDTK